MEHQLALVACDLDRTLIYSRRASGLGRADHSTPLRCVEWREGAPLSYLTEQAARLLGELAAEAIIVPVTTRTREQYARVNLPGPVANWRPPYAICGNGGRLLVDGAADPEWDAVVAARLAGDCATLGEVVEQLARRADPAWTRGLRTAEGLFAYLVVERELLPAGWLVELTGWCAERGWTVSPQGSKVYAVPKPLTKSAALAEVVRRVGGSPLVLAAGDSLLDADLLLAADQAWRPGHGELAELGWPAGGGGSVTALTKRGVLAGEEIVRTLLARVRAERS
ncbi:HAD family hydrolase [Kitasatospora sp. NPDC052896]|uniref:HAD family hydrolase n=1 Tax=Kitasatospora sp. NPDC052896 TaxID=3364061 RepID=UPI0037C992E5